MSHADMLQLFDFERVLFDQVIPRDRDALYTNPEPRHDKRFFHDRDDSMYILERLC